MRNALYLFRKHGGFTSTELAGMLVTAVLAGFYLSFDDWGSGAEADVLVGLQNFLAATLAVAMILALVVIAQKIIGIILGYKIHYLYSWVGLLLGFFITGFSAGAVPFFLPGGITYDTIKTARLGKYRLIHKETEMFTIASLAVVVPLLFSIPFGTLYVLTGDTLFRNLTVAALSFAIFALIPLPNLRSPHYWFQYANARLFRSLEHGTYGYDLFSFSMVSYVLLGATTLVFTGLALLFNTFSIILSVILALLIIGVYKITMRYFEK